MQEVFYEEKCPVCNEKFAEKDDVVVCPECGTPYHRKCYAENSKCLFLQEHGEFFWKGEKQALIEHCNKIAKAREAKESSIEEEIDLENVSSYEEFTLVMEKQVLNQHKDFGDVDGVNALELVKYLNKSAFHYMRSFNDIKKNGKILKLNFAALFFFPLHSFYRKANLFGVILMVLAIILGEARILITQLPALTNAIPAEFANLTMVLVTAAALSINLFSFMFFDYFYFKNAVKKIKRIKEENHGKSSEHILKLIAEEGRPSIFAGVAFTACTALVCALALQLLNNFLGII